jgi:serine/threonine-protein kinase
MTLNAGGHLGPYEILSALGAGGMGEVYRARDTKLNRDVALKILPEAFTLDGDRIARFRREAQVLASLNHPSIAAIYGFEDSGSTHALVLELVEGPTLADRIAEGSIPLDETLPIARQIAEAIEAAHEQGIIHRDLKPANIKVREDGSVKVLDFGLAKAFDPATSSGASATMSPTLSVHATQAGFILGTAAYMAPEQARGKTVDRRADIWAFGCVLYEMLTGRRAFEGDDISTTLASVLKTDPDWELLPPTTPPGLRRLLARCLKKDRKDRLQAIGEARIAIDDVLSGAVDESVSSAPIRPTSWWRRALLVAAGAAVGAATAALVWRRPPTPPLPVTRFVIALPQGQQLASRMAMEVSPDGTHIVYAADGRLYVRSLSEFEPRVVAGADDAIAPVFSPDNQWLAYWTSSDATLKRIPVAGGTPVTICQVSRAPSGLNWSGDSILFAQSGAGIMRVPATGGKAETLVRVGVDVAQAYRPQLLPGDVVLFTLARRTATAFPWEQAQIVAQSLKTGERKTIIDGATDGRYMSTGHLVYAAGGAVFAVPFDVARLAVTGTAVPVIEGVGRVASVVTGGAAQVAYSDTGTLIYAPGPAASGRLDVALFDRKGGAEALHLPAGFYAYPHVSPDGKRLALETSDGKDTNIAIYDLSGATAVRRLTFGGTNRFPIWSDDSRRVAFQSDREGDQAVFAQPADGGTAERLTRPGPGTAHVPESWSPDGGTLLYSVSKGADRSLWMLSTRDHTSAPFSDVRATTLPSDAAFSPDGRWVAYQLGQVEQGEANLYVQPFPPNGSKYQIARGGRPAWSRTGGELFYIPAAGQFVVVKITAQPTFSFSNPTAIPRGFGIADPLSPRPYDVMPDGRIVGVQPVLTSGAVRGPQINVVLNWSEELKRLVPTK